MRFALIALLAFATLADVRCGGSRPAAPIVTPPGETAASATSPGLTPTSQPEGFKIGEPVPLDGGLTLTIHGLFPVPVTDPREVLGDAGYLVADVEGCAADKVQWISGSYFEIAAPKYVRLWPSPYGAREPNLGFTSVAPGECVRGFVTFVAPRAAEPSALIYTAGFVEGQAVRFALP